MKKYKIDDIANIIINSGLITANDYLSIHGSKTYTVKTLITLITSVLIPALIEIGYTYNLNDEIGGIIYNKLSEVIKEYEKRNKN